MTSAIFSLGVMRVLSATLQKLNLRSLEVE